MAGVLFASVSAQPTILLRPNLGGHTSMFTGMSFVTESEVITTGLDRLVYRWNLETSKGVPIRYPIGTSYGEALDVHASGQYVAFGISDPLGAGVPNLYWSTPAGENSATLKGGAVKVQWSPSHESIAVLSADSLQVVQIEGAKVRTLALPVIPGKGATAPISPPNRNSISYSSDGSKIYLAMYRRDLEKLGRFTIDAQSGKVLGEPELVNATVGSSSINSAGDLAYTSPNGETFYWPKGKKATLLEISPKPTYGNVTKISPDGKTIVTSVNGISSPARVVIHRTDDGKQIANILTNSPTSALAFSPDGKTVGYGIDPSDIGTYSLTKGVENPRIVRSTPMANRLSWTEDGRALLWNSSNYFLTLSQASSPATDGFDFRSRMILPNPGTTLFSSVAKNDQLSLEWTTGSDKRVLAKNLSTGNFGATESINAPNGAKLAVLSQDRFAVYWGIGPFTQVLTYQLQGRTVSRTDDLRVQTSTVLALAYSSVTDSLALSSIDQQIRVYRLSKPELNPQNIKTRSLPDLTLMTSLSGEWVVFDERAGFYDSSPGGDQLIGFQRQEGGKVDFVPAANLAAKFRKPELIQGYFAGQNLPVVSNTSDTIQAQAELVPGLTIIGVSKVENSPGEVSLVRGGISPTDVALYETTAADVDILVEVTERISKDQVKLKNGTGSKSASDGLSVELDPDDNQLTIRAKLFPGKNRLKVYAVTKDGKSSEAIVEVNRKGAKIENNWDVFVLAVPEFENADFGALPGVQEDGEAISAFFKGQDRKLGAVSVYKCPTNETNASQIKGHLSKFADSVAGGENVLLYISSHGYSDPNGNYFIASRDSDVKQTQTTGINWEFVQAKIKEMNQRGARNIVMFIDSCYSGQVNPVNTKPGPENAYKNSRSLQENTIVITSSQPGQKSWTLSPDNVGKLDAFKSRGLPKAGMSLFTHSLMRGLTGQIPQAVRSDGKISLLNLLVQVKADVVSTVQTLQDASDSPGNEALKAYKQTPSYFPEPEDDIIIAVK